MGMRSFTTGFKAGLAWVVVALCAGMAPGCGQRDGHAHESSGHAHQPKNGGRLVEVGRHQFNVEVLVDAPKGRVTAWFLDAHAEDYVRIAMPALRMTAVLDGQQREMSLAAVAHAASGEKVGDTSQFEGSAEWLKGVTSFSATLHDVAIRGANFGSISFQHGPTSKAP